MTYFYSYAKVVVVLHLLSLLLCNLTHLIYMKSFIYHFTFPHLTSPLNPEIWLVKKWFGSLGKKAEVLLILEPLHFRRKVVANVYGCQNVEKFDKNYFHSIKIYLHSIKIFSFDKNYIFSR